MDGGEEMIRGNSRKARSLIELIVVWVAIFIIIGFVLGRANILLLKAREASLRNELSNFRLAISLYYVLNKDYPDNIEMLVGMAYNISPRKGLSLKGIFLDRLRYDKDGRLKDPFGKIYLYRQGIGMVKSQVKGYENW